MLRKIFFLSSIVFLACCGQHERNQARTHEEFRSMLQKKITKVDDIYYFFPKTVIEIHDHSRATLERAQKGLDAILVISSRDRTFDNTVRALDSVGGEFGTMCGVLSVLEMVSPIAEIRDACHQEVLKLSAFAVDAFSNKKIYQAFKDYCENDPGYKKLSSEQRYYLDESMKDFKRSGFTLPDDLFNQVKSIKKELVELGQKFDLNIARDQTKVACNANELVGCDPHFIEHLQRDEKGNVLVGCDYPSYFEVIGHCKHEKTRKRLFKAFNNRAYPENITLLEKIIAQRDLLAKTLGFESFAALDIDSEMAHKVDRVEHFTKDLAAKANIKAQQEFSEWSRDLPEGVVVDQKGRFKPWDVGYVKEIYKKKNLNVDDREIAQYFEVERTLRGVFDIYQNFLNLSFKLLKPAWAWHDDVRLIEVHERESGALRGYVFLDLFPRDNKYSHACHCGLVQSIKVKNADGVEEKTPSMGIVIANFPRATADRPALLKHGDVETFFHEFGHAMHFLLGSTELISCAGTAVKTDFVEMPSQIFEEWMFDKELLKNLSHHYQTGAHLSDELIEKIIALKKFDSGSFVTRQCYLSMVSLELFKSGEKKDIATLTKTWYENFVPQISFDPETHMVASFGHLVGYGAKYYSYMWSKVFALDLFYALKEHGITNSAAGTVFVNKVLAKGGSDDPNNLLNDYLGREPQQKAFFNDLGIDI